MTQQRLLKEKWPLKQFLRSQKATGVASTYAREQAHTLNTVSTQFHYSLGHVMRWIECGTW